MFKKVLFVTVVLGSIMTTATKSLARESSAQLTPNELARLIAASEAQRQLEVWSG
jgi:hypothetical protein